MSRCKAFRRRTAFGGGRVEGVYERQAVEFDRTRMRGLVDRPWLERMLALTAPDAQVLDLGCGAGEPLCAVLSRKSVAEGLSPLAEAGGAVVAYVAIDPDCYGRSLLGRRDL